VEVGNHKAMIKENKVILTYHEVYMGACIGVARQLASLRRGETNKVQNVDFGWHSNIEASCAELALAKHLGVFWDGSINTFKEPDVGCLQVRHTQLTDGCLILRNRDDAETRYVLVVGTHPEYLIVGWAWGGVVMRDKFLRDPGGKYPAWFVPQVELQPIGCLDWPERVGSDLPKEGYEA